MCRIEREITYTERCRVCLKSSNLSVLHKHVSSMTYIRVCRAPSSVRSTSSLSPKSNLSVKPTTRDRSCYPRAFWSCRFSKNGLISEKSVHFGRTYPHLLPGSSIKPSSRHVNPSTRQPCSRLRKTLTFVKVFFPGQSHPISLSRAPPSGICTQDKVSALLCLS